MQPAVYEAPAFPEHQLVDSGGGEKLERFGAVLVRRPDPQALWRPRLEPETWAQAHLCFERDVQSGGRHGTWKVHPAAVPQARAAEPAWPVRFGDAVCIVRPTPFKHMGLFPEQAANWVWLKACTPALGEPRPRLLNLFGYTAMASIVALQAGWEVTHVDASRTTLAWARENLVASGLGEDAMRLVLDDAAAFARREVRRGARYHGVLLDPPHHGRGPKGERWQFEEHLAGLVEACEALLAERSFLVLSTYAIGSSPLAFANLLEAIPGGRVSAGELALSESGPGARRLPCGFCARWWRGFEAGER